MVAERRVGAQAALSRTHAADCGVVSVVGCYYVQAAPAHGSIWGTPAITGALPLRSAALGLPLGTLTTNILIIDDIRDREVDRVKGKLTVAVRFGRAWSRAEFLALLLLSYVAPLWLWLGLGFSQWILLPWLSAPLAWKNARGVLAHERFEDLAPLTPRAGRLLLAYSALLATGAAVHTV
jgi:1,4-dihydroxy-2-naphthoate octaprenyltransferase